VQNLLVIFSRYSREEKALTTRGPCSKNSLSIINPHLSLSLFQGAPPLLSPPSLASLHSFAKPFQTLADFLSTFLRFSFVLPLPPHPSHRFGHSSLFSNIFHCWIWWSRSPIDRLVPMGRRRGSPIVIDRTNI
jgi:hypothetical protein